MLAQRIEKETVGAQLSRTVFHPCPLPIGQGARLILLLMTMQTDPWSFF